MSSIDDRIVNMQFNNANFEKGVRESLNSIKNLEVSLKSIDGQSVSFDQIQNAVNSLKLDNISTNASAIADRFDTMGIIGMTAISKLTSSVMDLAGGALVSLKNKVTAVWDAIAGGGMQRAQNIEQAKFTIEGLGKAWDDVADSIDYAVSDTAYGLDEAAIAASQFLATGVETGDKMTRSLTAISGLSAMTNSSYSEMARIMTTIAGNGRVMANELNQIGARGVNAAATLRDYFNRTSESMEKYRKLYNETKSKTQEPIAEGAKLTEQNIRDMVSKGVIDFQTFSDAMYEAFGEHAKDAQETFSGASANVTAALKRIGADFQSVTISSEDYKKTLDETGKVDFTKETFNQINVLNKLRDVLKGLQTELRNSGIVKGFTDIYHAISRGMTFFLNGFMDPLNTTSKVLAPELREALVNIKGAIENVVGFVVGIASSVSAAWHTIFPESLNQTILSITEGIKSFTDMLPRVSDISGTISEMFGLTGFDTSANTESTNTVVENANAVAEAYNGVTGSLKDLVAQVINGDWGNGQERIDALGDSYDQIQDSVNSCYDSELRLHEDWIDNIDDTIMVGQELNDTLNDTAQAEASAKRVDDAYNKIKDTIGNIIPGVKDSETAFEGLRVVLEGVFSAIDMVRKAIMGAIEIVRRFVLPVAARIGEVFFTIIGTIASWVTALNKALPSHSSFIKGLDGISKILEPLWSIFYKVTGGIIDFFKALRPGGDPLGVLRSGIESLVPSIDIFGVKLTDIPKMISEAMGNVASKVSGIKLPSGNTLGSSLGVFIAPVLEFFKNLPKQLGNLIEPTVEFFSKLGSKIGDVIALDDTIPEKLSKIFGAIGESISPFVNNITKRFQPIIDIFKSIASNIKRVVGSAFEPIIDAFKSFKSRVSSGENPIAILKGQFDDFLHSMGPIGTAIANIIDSIAKSFRMFFDDIANSIGSSGGDPLKVVRNVLDLMIGYLKNAISRFSSLDIVSTIRNIFTTVVEAVKAGFEFIKSIVQPAVEEFFKFINDIFSKNKVSDSDDAMGLRELSGNVATAATEMAGPADRLMSILEGIGTKLNEYSAVILTAAGAIAIGFAGSKMFKSVETITKSMADVSQSIASVARSIEHAAKIPAQISGLLNEISVSLGKFRKSIDFALISEGIKSVAIAFGILAAVLIVLGNVPWDVIQQGGIALGSIALGFTIFAGVLIALAKVAKTSMKDVSQLMGFFVGVAATIAIIALVMGKLGSMNPDALMQGAGALIGIVMALSMLAAIAVGVGDDLTKAGEGMLLVAGAVTIVVLAFTALAKITSGSDITQAMLAFVLISVALGALSWAASEFASRSNDLITGAGAMLIISAALAVLTGALYAISVIAAGDKLGQATATLILLGAGLAALAYAASKFGGPQLLMGAVGMLAMGAALLLLTGALGMMTQIVSNDAFGGAAVALIVLAAALAVLMYVAQDFAIGAVLLDVALLGIAAVILAFGIAAVLGGVAINLMVTALERLSEVGNNAEALNGIVTFVNQLVTIAPQLLLLAGILVLVGVGMVLVGAGALLLGAGMILLSAGLLLGAVGLIAFTAALQIFLGFLETGAMERITAHTEALLTFAGVFVVIGLALVVFGAGAIIAGAGIIVFSLGLIVAAGAIVTFTAALAVASQILIIAIQNFQIAGQMIPEGIANGISSGVGAVVNAISAVAQTLVNAFMSLLGINSPSKVFQQLGVNCDEGLENGIQQGSGGVQNAMSGVGNELMNTLTSFIPGMENKGKEAGKAGASGVSNGWMDQLSQSIGGGDFDLTKLPEGMNIDQFTNMVSSAGSNSGTAFGQSYSKSSAQAIAENSASAEEAVAAVDSIADAAQAEVDARFPEIGKSAMDKLREGFQNTDLGTAITESITQSFESVNTVGTELANNIKTGIESVDLTAVGTESAERYMTGFDTIKERIATVGTDAATAFKSGIEVIDLTAVGMQSGTQYSQGLTASLLQAMSIGVQFANNVKLGIMSVSMTDAGAKVAVDFANGLRSNSGSMRGAGALLGNAVRDGAASANLSSVGAQKGQQFASGVMMAFGAATSAGRSLANAAVAGAMVSNMRSAGIYNGQLFASGIITASGMASSAGSALANAARNGAWSNAGGMYEVGAYMSEGFAAGIEANVWRAAAAAATLAVIAENVVALKLRIFSPSRVMMGLGGYVTEGFAIGIEDNMSMVSDAATSVADSALETMSDVVSSIMDVLDIDSDMSPTITPVLDTSSVERGMNQINSMFGDRQLNNSYAMGLASGMSGFAPSTGISETSLAKAIAEEFIKADTRPNVDATFIVNDVDNPQRFARDTMHKVAQLQRAR